jgi:hypothetical protein
MNKKSIASIHRLFGGRGLAAYFTGFKKLLDYEIETIFSASAFFKWFFLFPVLPHLKDSTFF